MKKNLFILIFFSFIILNLYVSANIFSIPSAAPSNLETEKIRSYVEVLNKNSEMERLEMLLKMIGVAKVVRITLKRTLYFMSASKARTALKYSGYLRKGNNKEIIDLLLPLVKEKNLDVRMNTFHGILLKQNPNYANGNQYGGNMMGGQSHNQFMPGNVEHPRSVHDVVVGVMVGL